MLGKTHKAGGALAMLISYLYMQQEGLLMDDIHPIIQLMVMYPASSWGSTASDLDQNANAIPDRTPVSYAIHNLLHITKCKHRSWQTHSIAVTGGFCTLLLLAVEILSNYNILSVGSISILRLLITGFSVGVFSHLILDSLTMAGIWLLPKVHFRLVPPTKTFGTGTTYETVVRVIIYIAIVLCLLYGVLTIFK